MSKRLFSRLTVLVWTWVFSLSVLTLVSAQPTAFLGINFEDSDEGVLVVGVRPGSPADEAGLLPGDIITAIADEAVTVETIADVVGGYAVGDTLALTVLRDDESLELEATLAPRPADLTPPDRPDRPGRPQPTPALQERAFLGVALVTEDEAVIITEVAESSPAEAAGLQADDVLVSINAEAVTEAEQAVEIVRALSPGDTVTLEVERDDDTLTIEVELGSIMVEPEPSFGGMRSVDVLLYDINSEAWRVVMLAEDSPLATAGVQAGDAITAIVIDGEPVTPADLDGLLDDIAEDAEAELTIERDDETLTVTLPAADLLAQLSRGGASGMSGMGMIPPIAGQKSGGTVRLGVGYTMLTEDLAAENDLDITEGALVNEVVAESPAEAAGLQVGDVITAINGDVVDTQRDLPERLYPYDPGDTVTLDVLRAGETLALEVTLEARAMNFGFEGLPFGFDGDQPFFFGPDGSFEFELPPLPEVTPELPLT